jgi:hypothetical protein
MLLARPNGRLSSASAKSFTMRDCLSCCYLFAL